MNSKKRKGIFFHPDGILFSLVTNCNAHNWVTVSVLLSSVDCLVFAKIIMRQVFMSRKKCGHIAWEIVHKLASTMVLRAAFCIPIFFACGYLSLLAWRSFLFTTPVKEFMNIPTVLSCYYIIVLVKIRHKVCKRYKAWKFQIHLTLIWIPPPVGSWKSNTGYKLAPN